ncbi:hypothetical protein BK026_17080 [Alteromonas sp. V450]|uniref:hypothetical protein n=1 Tax=Alteromonas sp. V450 TaxID=1912139 RepID=UPI0009111B80|nr:hypothetical protein [Alteromonas sp. V450]OJF70350.1 hypothetical protein BK026_17080 [Alteromonas sp. V450]
MNNSQKLCDLDQLKEYLHTINEPELLQYISEDNGSFALSEKYYSSNVGRFPSIKLQLAACLAVLGEPTKADNLAPLSWGILNRGYDKVANGIISEFTQSWPRL